MHRLAWSGLLLCMAAILRLLGPIEGALECLLIAAGLAAWCFGTAGRPNHRPAPSWPWLRWWRWWRWLMAPAGFAGLVRIEDPSGRLAILALIVLATPAAYRSAAAGCIGVFAAWCAFVPILPGAWSIPVALSRLLSAGVGTVAPTAADAGPTASGLWLLVVWLVALCALRCVSARSGWIRCLTALGLVCVNAATLGLSWGVGRVLLLAHHEVEPGPHASGMALFVRGPLLLALLCALLPGLPAERADGRRSSPALRATLAAVGSLLAVGLVLSASTDGARRAGDVVVRDSAAFDMQVPMPERYGTANAGMFGMLPRYLALDGHHVRVERPPIEPASLERATVLVVILPTSRLDAAEKRAIHAFVERGGSLLVLGDHTDLMSTMDPINDLTGRFGMHLRFDSAFPARAQWAACLAGVRAPPSVGTGASLTIHGSALPILRAPYAFSDRGDRRNAGQEAWSGDRRWTRNEQAGDLVLAAESRFGLGRVVLFGDTSIFQNVMLPWSWEFVMGLFDSLARSRVDRSLFVALSTVCAAWLAVVALRGNAWASGALALSVLAPLAASWITAVPGPAFEFEGAKAAAGVAGPCRVALIDDAHANRYARHLWENRSIGGLVVSLQRSGWIPIVSRRGFARPLHAGSLAILIEPRVPLSPGEIERLDAHRAGGGTLLVAAGARARAPLAGLLAPHRMRIRPLPLGPVPVRGDLDAASYERALREPQFRDAWPVEAPAGARSHFTAFGYDIVVDAPRQGASSGRLVVLGDPDFLTDRVLENETAAWPGNVAFLDGLLAFVGDP